MDSDQNYIEITSRPSWKAILALSVGLAVLATPFMVALSLSERTEELPPPLPPPLLEHRWLEIRDGLIVRSDQVVMIRAITMPGREGEPREPNTEIQFINGSGIKIDGHELYSKLRRQVGLPEMGADAIR